MASEQVAEVKEAVETIAEAVGAAEGVEAALEAAEEAQEAAEEAAELLAAAAMETERARRIEALEQQVTTWQSEQAARLESLTAELSQVNTRITEVLDRANTPPVVTVTTPGAAPEIPSILSPLEAPQETVVTVSPSDAGGDGLPAAAPAAPAKRGARWL